MKKNMLRKDFFMEIRKSWGRFISIFLIVALGVAFYAGIRASEPSMRISGDSYFDKEHLMDIKVMGTMGLTEEELPEIVERWRRANPAIVQLWYTVEAAAWEVVRHGRRVAIQEGRLVLARECDPENGLDFLTIRLPSGRKLYYAHPHEGQNRFGRPAVCYYGMNQSTKRWETVETYGGKLVENITQAAARDCLAEAVERLEAAGYPVVFHIHDEVVVDAPDDRQSLDRVEEIMSQAPDWAPGLPLNADGWVNPFFKKE